MNIDRDYYWSTYGIFLQLPLSQVDLFKPTRVAPKMQALIQIPNLNGPARHQLTCQILFRLNQLDSFLAELINILFN